jgi:hypothetical protein
VAAHGGWTALVDRLLVRLAAEPDAPTDPGTVEKGLRRLSARGHKPGGQYGRWVLRHLGVPRPLEDWARWLGQYHSRLADLPTPVREAQLRLWDRPPLAESRAYAWVQLGLASVALRQQDVAGARARLGQALARVSLAGPAAALEARLLEARLASDAHEEVASALAAAASALASPLLDEEDRACYLARLRDQEAYQLLHPRQGPPRVNEALEVYASIPAHPAPFVGFRRELGLGYCAYKLGRPDEAAARARSACEHAGDGGLVRFRVMSLSLLARVVPPAESAAIAERAARLAAQLGDEDLLRRARPARP